MRTTVDLRPDLHRRALALARDSRRTLSATINDLLSRVLEADGPPQQRVSEATGLHTVRLGRPVAAEEVRELADE